MNILLSGSSGLVGTALIPALTDEGHRVIRLVRRDRVEGARTWKPSTGRVDPAVLDGVDAVIHLGGVSLAEGRWTESRKRLIRDSRVRSTRALAEAMAAASPRPSVFVVASAMGYYGDQGDRELDESAPAGKGFLAGVCVEWEAAADAARSAGVRVVHLRSGLVLSPNGGSLAKMLPPFRLGLGGPLGSGDQYMSWIMLSDFVRAIRFVLNRTDLVGPVNVAAPEPVRNREFSRVLGKVLGRPVIASVPAFVLRVMVGELADEALLASQRLVPAKLQAAQFRFDYPDLESGLREVLRTP